MVATTSAHGFPYYQPGDPPNIADATQQLAAKVDDALPRVLGHVTNNEDGSVLLASSTGNYAPVHSQLAITIAEQRLLYVRGGASIAPASGSTAAGQYTCRIGYNTGTTLNPSAIQLQNPITTGSVGGNGYLFSLAAEAWIVMPAGTYLLYAIVSRPNGGNGGDNIYAQAHIAAIDWGPA